MSLLGERFISYEAPQTDAGQTESVLDLLPSSAKDRITLRFGDLNEEDKDALQSLAPLFKVARKNQGLLPMFVEKKLEETRKKNGLPYLPAKDVVIDAKTGNNELAKSEIDHHLNEAKQIIKAHPELEDEEVDKVHTDFSKRFQDVSITDFLPALASKAAAEAARRKLAKQQNSDPQSDTPLLSQNKQSTIEANNQQDIKPHSISKKNILFRKPKKLAKNI